MTDGERHHPARRGQRLLLIDGEIPRGCEVVQAEQGEKAGQPVETFGQAESRPYPRSRSSQEDYHPRVSPATGVGETVRAGFVGIEVVGDSRRLRYLSGDLDPVHGGKGSTARGCS